MINGSSTLVAVRRREGPNLSKTLVGPEEPPKSATPVLQMLLGELAALRQQVNAVAVSRPSSLQPTTPPGQKGNTTDSKRVQSSRLTRVFD